MVIQHNLTAMNSNLRLSITNGELEKKSRKLSSGYRIAIAADDAAGLSISEKMRRKIRGLDMAAANAQDGISLVQTAEGALNEVHSMLQRMSELAVKAANETNSDVDREYIQTEIKQLKTEIDRVASTTKFNEKNLLDGGLSDPDGSLWNVTYATTEDVEGGQLVRSGKGFLKALNGEKAGENVSLEDVREASGLSIIYEEMETDYAATQVPGGEATVGGYNNLKQILEQEIVPQAVKAILDTYPDTFGYLNNSSVGIGLKLMSNPSSGNLASVTMGYTYYNNGELMTENVSYKLTINMAYLKMDAGGNLQADSRRVLETTVVHEMMHALMYETLTNGMIGANNGFLDRRSAFPSWFKEGMAQASAGGCSNDNDWVNGALKINSSTSEAGIASIIKSGANNLKSGSMASKYGTGYLASMYLGYLVNGKTAVEPADVASGLDTLMNEIKNGKSLDEVIKEKTSYNGLKDFENRFGDAESSKFVKELVARTGNYGNGGLVTGDYTNNDLLPDASYNTNLFELNTNYTSVINRYDPSTIKFADGGSGFTGGGFPVKGKGLNLHIGSEAGEIMTIHIAAMNTDVLGVWDVDVSTAESADMAITSIKSAIEIVSKQRSDLGAYQNRLEHTIANLKNASENTQGAESLIRDTDMAKEMVGYSQNQILMQVGQSVLAQANQSNQGILSLLS